MKNQIYTEIINLIDSVCMRNYLLENQAELGTYHYLDIIAGAPVSLNRKQELLVALENVAQNNREKKEIAEHLNLLEDALNKLYSFSPDKSVLIIVNIYYDSDSGQPVYTHDEFFPAVSYRGAQLTIQRYNDECELEPGEIPPWYWKLELYQIQEDGTTQPDYTYICSLDGEVQYFYCCGDKTRRRTRWDQPFGSSSPNLNLPVPYQPGDILYVDCRPYTQPAYCLIMKVGNDCCGIQCLYRRGHTISAGAFKHGHYSEDADGEEQYLSPLYRAELYEEELPPEYAFMARFSQKLKQNPEYGRMLSDVIWHLP